MRPSRSALLSGLLPFADAFKEVRSIGGIPKDEQFIWKPQNGNRKTNGISVAHLSMAARLIKEELEGIARNERA